MKLFVISSIFVFVLLMGLHAFASEIVIPAHGKIGNLDFMVGSFKGLVSGSPAEAHFMKPIQGKILGVTRIESADSNQDFVEFSRIEESDFTITLTPMPFGKDGVTFVATSIEPKKVVFENPDHAFPHRIVYQLLADGSLLTQVLGKQDGKPMVIEYTLNRTDL